MVICGSTASWIIEKLVNNKGGLHNRITQRIRLLPFTLGETENYLKQQRINLDPYQILQLYMVTGGVPYYLNAIERGMSAEQNIEKCCFSKDGTLANEFNNLYPALFNNPLKHIEVIRALSRKNKGLKLDWIGIQKTHAYIGWSGYAFENICLKHINQLKKALQIGGVHTSVSSWYQPGNDKYSGAQIDLLIDRADQCINICEIKFSTKPFVIEKKYAADLQNKMMAFRMATDTKKTFFLTFITTYGVYENDYKYQRVDAEITAQSLFAR